MNSFMTCIYNKDTQKLTVTSPVKTDITGTSITFEVDNFINPYSGVPRTGYFITTTDSLDGQIDSSLIANIVMKLQVTDWAMFA